MATTLVQKKIHNITISSGSPASIDLSFDSGITPGNLLVCVIESTWETADLLSCIWKMPEVASVENASALAGWGNVRPINEEGREVIVAFGPVQNLIDYLTFTLASEDSNPGISGVDVTVRATCYEFTSSLGPILGYMNGASAFEASDSATSLSATIEPWMSTASGYTKECMYLAFGIAPPGVNCPDFDVHPTGQTGTLDVNVRNMRWQEQARSSNFTESLTFTAGQGTWGMVLLQVLVPQSKYRTEFSQRSSGDSISLSQAPTVGNLMILTARSASGVPDDLSGWNKIEKSTSGIGLAVFWKEAGADEDASITITGATHIDYLEVSGFDRAPTALINTKADYEIARGGGDDAWMAENAGQTVMPISVPDDDAYFFAVQAYPEEQEGSFLLPDFGVHFNRWMLTSGDGWDFYPDMGFEVSIYGFWFPTPFDGNVVGIGALFVNDPNAPLDPPTPTSHIFPDEGQRLAYLVGDRRGTALSSAKSLEFEVYSDADATVLADITRLDGEPIEDSIIAVGDDSRLPLFKGAEGVTKLYIKVPGSAVITPIDASLSDQIALLNASVFPS